MIDPNMLRRDRENVVRRTAVSDEKDGDRLLKRTVTTRRPWFDHLINCAI
jgi:hypothetical protein